MNHYGKIAQTLIFSFLIDYFCEDLFMFVYWMVEEATPTLYYYCENDNNQDKVLKPSSQ